MGVRCVLVRAVSLLALCCAFVVSATMPVGACLPPPPPRPGVTPPTPIPTMTVSETAAQATVIFRGYPTRRDDVSYTISDTNATRTTFAVETLWKGPSQPTFTILTMSCGAPDTGFAANGIYIIYARGSATGDLSALDHSRLATATEPEDTMLGPGTRFALPTAQPSVTAATPTAAPLSAATPTVVPTDTPIAAPLAQPTSDLGRNGWLLPVVVGGVIGAVGTLLASSFRRKRTR